MDFKGKIDFCIFITSYNDGDKVMIFVTPKDNTLINPKLCAEPEYNNLKMFLSGMGYKETDECVFESDTKIKTDTDQLSADLIKAGMNFSPLLQKNIIEDYKAIFAKVIETPNVSTSSSLPVYSSNITNGMPGSTYNLPANIDLEPVKKELIERLHVPKKGDAITLYFYIYLSPVYFSSELEFEFVADVFKDDTKYSNFIGIVKSEFVRIDDGMSNLMILQSTKTHSELFNEIDMLHSGCFMLPQNIVDDAGNPAIRKNYWKYNIMEIRGKIKMQKRLLLQIDINNTYEVIMGISKGIKKEYMELRKKEIDLVETKNSLETLRERFMSKMHVQSDKEMYERAAITKKDVQIIEERIHYIDKARAKKVTHKKYLEHFFVPQS